MVRRTVHTTPDEERLLAELGTEPLHVDEVGRRCQLAPATLSSTLALLELKGLVRQVSGMAYIKL